MTVHALELTVEPDTVVADDGTFGGFSKIAQHLNDLFPLRKRPFYRQQVHRWFTCRGTNRFPAPYRVMTKDGKIHNWFRISAVEQWYRENFKEKDPHVANADLRLLLILLSIAERSSPSP